MPLRMPECVDFTSGIRETPPDWGTVYGNGARMTEEQKLKLDLGAKQTVPMSVSSQIIEHLSKGLYDNPLKAIRELVSNAFDADAKRVTIRAKPNLKRITITDDGVGMN